MGKHEIDILNYCEQFFYEAGRLPSEKEVLDSGFDQIVFRAAVKLPSFNLALENRSITPYYMLDENGNPPVGLSAPQLLAIACIQDTADTRSKVKKLAELGITSQQWTAWCNDARFNTHMQKRAERIFGSAYWEVQNGLVHAAKNGDTAATKLFMEITGRYQPANNKVVDIQAILFRVLEIIQKYVPDRTTQAIIANELLALAESAAPKLDGAPIVNPGFKEIREIEAEVVTPTPVTTPVEVLKSPVYDFEPSKTMDF